MPSSPPLATSSYFTFGYDMVARYAGRTYDCDSIVHITSPNPRATMFQMFGQRWGFEYPGGPDNTPPNTFGDRIIVEVVQLQEGDEIVVTWP